MHNGQNCSNLQSKYILMKGNIYFWVGEKYIPVYLMTETMIKTQDASESSGKQIEVQD